MTVAAKVEDPRGLWVAGYQDKWGDYQGWCLLPRGAKALYQQIIEQPTMTYAGVLMAGPDVLADQHPNTPSEEIEKDLQDLINNNWIVQYGSLLWVPEWFRLYVRDLGNPKYLPRCLKAIRAIPKPDLRMKVTEALVEAMAEYASRNAKAKKATNAQVLLWTHEIAAEMSVPSSTIPRK